MLLAMTDGSPEPHPADFSTTGSAASRRYRRFTELERAWLPILAGMLVAVVASLSWLDLLNPYLYNDDFNMLLPDHTGVVRVTGRLLDEGRWLNYWWWQLGSQHLGTRGALLLFTSGWLALVGVLVRSLSIGWWSIPAVAAIYSAPMMSMISVWPATLAVPLWTTAITAMLLWVTRERWLVHVATLGIGVVIIALGYPPLSLMLLPFLALLHQAKTWPRLSLLGATFVAAYIGGLLAAFTLNDLKFGLFGVKIAPWRHPTALNSLHSLSLHMGVVWTDAATTLRVVALPVIASVCALAAGLTEKHLRRRMLVLTLALIVGEGLNAASTITDGVTVPVRAMAWLWPAIVVIAVWALDVSERRLRIVGAVALIFIALWSGLFWAHDVLQDSSHERALSQLRVAIAAQHSAHPAAPIIFVEVNAVSSYEDHQVVLEEANALAKFNGIRHVGLCWACAPVAAATDRLRPRTWVFYLGGRVVIQTPPSLAGSVLHDAVVPRWLAPFN